VLSRRWRNIHASFIAFVPYAVLVASLVIVLVRTYSLGRYTLNSHPKTLNCIQHTEHLYRQVRLQNCCRGANDHTEKGWTWHGSSSEERDKEQRNANEGCVPTYKGTHET
jgi:hypothetical protein